ncbi:hypothetical protein SALBM217S_02531 [Streptomyces griseoloalbus]
MDPPRAAPAHLVLRRMLHRLRPALEASGDFGTVRDLLDEALAAGSAAHRLRRTVREADLPTGIDLLVTETRGGRLPARAGARRPRPQVTARHAAGRPPHPPPPGHHPGHAGLTRRTGPRRNRRRARHPIPNQESWITTPCPGPASAVTQQDTAPRDREPRERGNL